MGKLPTAPASREQLNRALLRLAQGHVDTILPGFTHLPIGQPVSFAHHLLAYVEMFDRDVRTLQDARGRMSLCPLGSAALAGTHFPIDPSFTAELLGFSGPSGQKRASSARVMTNAAGSPSRSPRETRAPSLSCAAR